MNGPFQFLSNFEPPLMTFLGVECQTASPGSYRLRCICDEYWRNILSTCICSLSLAKLCIFSILFYKLFANSVSYVFCISPRGFRLKCYYALFLVCCGCDTSYIGSVHIQCQASIYTLSLCRGHSWRMRLAKQETPTPPGHLVSPLVCRVHECPPWCFIAGATVTVHQFFCILHSGSTLPNRTSMGSEIGRPKNILAGLTPVNS